MRIDENGNVGVGTNTPKHRLDLGSDAPTTVTSDAGKKLAVSNSTAGTDFYGLGVSSNTLQIHAGSDKGSAPAVVLTRAGNFGVGTTSPTHNLHVNGSVKIENGSQGAGKVLTSDANGVATWVTPATTANTNIYTNDGTLSGNRKVTQGTNTLAFEGSARNAFSVDGTTLSVDAANNRVGLGTSTPDAKLHVAGNVKIVDGTQGNNKVLTSDAAGVATWKDLPTATDTNVYNSNGTLSADRTVAQTNKKLAFTATTTNAFSVDGTTFSVDAANDRVGLGTSTPDAKLHVAGNVKIVDGTQGNNKVLTSDAAGLATWKDLPTATDTNVYNSNGTLSADRTIAQTNKKLAFTATATNAFSVDGTTLSVDAANNRVGIGTASPTHNLHVNGSLKIQNGSQGAGKVLTSDASGVATWTAPTVTADTSIYTNDGTLSGNRKVTQGTNTLAFEGSARNAFSVDGTTLSVDAANNRVGIGTSTPDAKLHVAGNVKIVDGTQGNNKVLTSDAAGVATWKDLPTATDTNVYNNNGTLSADRTVAQTNKKLAFTATTTNAFSVDGTTFSVDAANDRVGLGTSTPDAKLHVAGNVKIVDGTQGNNKVLTSDAAGVATWKDLPTATDTNVYNSNGTLSADRTVAQTNKKLAFTATATNAFSVDGATFSVDAANNRIGIGTASPTHNLHVNGSLKIQNGSQGAGKVLTSDASGVATWTTPTVTADTSIYTNDGTLSGDRKISQGGNKLAFESTAKNAFSVDGTTLSVDAANNRIGLGTADPMGKLDITADNSTSSVDKEVFIKGFGTSKNPKIYMSSANGTAAAPTNLATDDVIGGMEFVPRAGNVFPWGYGSGISSKYKGNGTTRLTDFTLKTSGFDRMIIDEYGSVGVGTLAPDAKLHVAGNVKIVDGTQGNNKVLTSDAAGVATWKDLPTATDTNVYNSNGTLSADRTVAQTNKKLAFTATATNAFSVDGTTFSVDAANNRIGIGTASPTHNLHVNGSLKIQNGSQGAGKVLTSDASGVATWTTPTVTADTSIYTNDGTLSGDRKISQGGNKLAFESTAKNAFSVDGTTLSVDAANNRIGLGTVDPMGKLDITADNSTSSVDKELFIRGFGTSKNPKIYMSSANGTAAAPTDLATDDVIGGMEFVPRSGNAFPWGFGSGISSKYRGRYLTTAYTDLTLKTSGAERMRIDENGNVGVGTLAPNAKLHVAGNVKIVDGTQGNNKVLTSDAAGLATWKDLPTATDTNVYNSNGTLSADRTVAQTNKKLAFTATATNAFSVDGTTFSVDAANNRIGIGTASPTHNLHVNGSLKIQNGSQGAGKVLTSDASGVATWTTPTVTADTSIYTNDGTLSGDRKISQGGNKLAFESTATNALSVDGATFSVDAANNRVGIGTTTPVGKLDITADNSSSSVDKELFIRGFGSSKNPKIYMSSANGTAAAPTDLATDDVIGGLDFVPRSGNAFPWGFGSGISSKYRGRYLTTDYTDLSLKTSGAERMRIDENGNVGVGTSAPNAKLHVNGSLRIENGSQGAGKVLTSEANGIATWTAPTVTADTNIYTNDGTLSGDRKISQGGNKLAFESTATNAFSVDGTTLSVDAANNRVGIGTASPTHNLHVNGSLKIQDGSQGSGKVLTSDASGVATWQPIPVSNTNWALEDIKYSYNSSRVERVAPSNGTGSTTFNNIPANVSHTVVLQAFSEAKIIISYDVPVTLNINGANSSGSTSFRTILKRNGTEIYEGRAENAWDIHSRSYTKHTNTRTFVQTISNPHNTYMTLTYSLYYDGDISYKDAFDRPKVYAEGANMTFHVYKKPL